MSTVCGERVLQSAGERPGAETIVRPPLAVDLDGTLLKTDLLIESVLALVRKQPWYLFMLPLWLARGKACLKHEVARRVSLDVATLPWRTETIAYLRQQRGEGRSLVLATGADERIAHQVSDYLKLFDLVLATDATTNLCGEAKRSALVSRFGERGFDYAADGGNAHKDLAVWRSAQHAVLVNPSAHLRKAAAKVSKVDVVLTSPSESSSARLGEYLTALRPQHWLKNLLVFVPLLAAHRLHENALFEKSLVAFVAFSCCASSGYLFNDLLDLEADRHHPHKRFRPFAAGQLPLSYALLAIPALLIAGCLLGAAISPLLLMILAMYFGLSAAYSLHIKKVPVLDVLFLAGLYTVRLMAGSAAVGIASSHWLLAFSTFLFFSLALVKRYGELVVMRGVDGVAAKARSYELSDAELLASMGTASGYLAVLVLALYIASDKAQVLYAHRELLWFLCPLLLYWISYIWLTAHRGKLLDDPIQFATRDRTSAILLVLMFLMGVIAL
jgi:4-hydroxybenzoate polyprenyltransferase/phosphoserine phosphatase